MDKIQEGNILIAEFMERRFWPFTEQGQSMGNGFEKYSECLSFIKRVNLNDWSPELGWGQGCGFYDSKWGWLMEVVEKISRYQYEDDDSAYLRTFGMINNTTGNPMVRFNRCTLFEAATLIEATWLAVVDFVKWYNQQIKK